MSEMIEKVARAIFTATEQQRVAFMGGAGHAFDDYSDTVQRNYIEQAQAALEAMREPTEAMIETGTDRVMEYLDGASAEEIYKAMISTAINATA